MFQPNIAGITASIFCAVASYGLADKKVRGLHTCALRGWGTPAAVQLPDCSRLRLWRRAQGPAPQESHKPVCRARLTLKTPAPRPPTPFEPPPPPPAGPELHAGCVLPDHAVAAHPGHHGHGGAHHEPRKGVPHVGAHRRHHHHPVRPKSNERCRGGRVRRRGSAVPNGRRKGPTHAAQKPFFQGHGSNDSGAHRPPLPPPPNPSAPTSSYYGSPLSTAVKIIKTKNSDSILLPRLVCDIGNSGLWTVYGIMAGDPFIIVPNGIGVTLGFCLAIIKVRSVCSGDGRGSIEPRRRRRRAAGEARAGRRAGGGRAVGLAASTRASVAQLSLTLPNRRPASRSRRPSTGAARRRRSSRRPSRARGRRTAAPRSTKTPRPSCECRPRSRPRARGRPARGGPGGRRGAARPPSVRHRGSSGRGRRRGRFSPGAAWRAGWSGQHTRLAQCLLNAPRLQHRSSSPFPSKPLDATRSCTIVPIGAGKAKEGVEQGTDAC